MNKALSNREGQELKSAQEILAAIDSILKSGCRADSLDSTFEMLLDVVLRLTHSEYGFIGEVLSSDEGTLHLKTHSISDIAWNDETKSQYRKKAPFLEFFNLDTLYGEVIKSSRPVISNSPKSDPRACGVPAGHPPMQSFLGVPLLGGDRLVGMVGLANSPDGYDESIVQSLQPFVSTCTSLIELLRTERTLHEAELALAYSEEFHKTLISTMAEGVVVYDADGDVLSCNHSAETILGLSESDMVGSNLVDALGRVWDEEGRTLTRHDCASVEVIKSSRPMRDVKVRFDRSDGRMIWMSLNIEPVREPSRILDARVVMTLRDITNQRRGEDELRRGQRLLDRAQKLANMGSWERDLQTNCLRWTDQMFVIFGLKKEYEKGLTWSLVRPLIHPADIGNVESATRECTAAMGTRTIEYRIIRPCGQYRIVLETFEVASAANGVVNKILGTTQDITEKRREEQRHRRIQQMEAVGALAAGIAHDFNNLTGLVSKNIELASAQIPVSDPAHARLEIAQEGLEQATNLAEALQIVSKRAPLARRRVSLLGLFEQSSKLLSQLVPISIEQHWETDDRPAFAFADATQLQQVLLNLITNARDAMPNGGTLRVKRELRELLGEEADAFGVTPGIYSCLEVRDTGVGMSEETLASVFEPFYTTKSAEGHSGLGLAVVKQVVDAHGARIQIESKEGAGTIVRSYMPCDPDQSSVIETEEDDEEASLLRGLRVLVVDPDAIQRSLVATGLLGQGMTIMQATDRESLEQVDSSPGSVVDLAILGPACDQSLLQKLRRRWPKLLCVQIRSDLKGNRKNDEHASDPLTAILRQPFRSPGLRSSIARLVRSQ